MSGPRKIARAHAWSAERMAGITSAVRALCVVYNTSLTYDTSHPVFLKATEERIPAFRSAIEIGDELPLSFSNGHIRVGTVVLEPASALFQKLAREFEAMGITGLTLLSGVSASDLRKLMRILTKKPRDVAAHGIQPLLEQEGIHTIQAARGRFHGDPASSGTRQAVSPAVDNGAAGTGSVPLTPADLFPGLPPPRNDAEDVPLRDTVRRLVSELPLPPADGYRLAGILSDELDRRVDAATSPLKTLLQLSLDVLNQEGASALLVGRDLNVRLANSLGHILLDGQNAVSPDSPLGLFLLSEVPSGEVEMAGRRFKVRQLGGSSAEGQVRLVWLRQEPAHPHTRRPGGGQP